MSIVLTAEERIRFATWLEHEAQVDKALVNQMEKLGTTFHLVVKEKILEVDASLRIAKKLRSIHGSGT